MPRSVAAFAWFFVVSTVVANAGDGPVTDVDRLFGSGVRAYYRGQLDQAIHDFDMATAYGSQDPRVYFFRGVSKLRRGRSDEARFDFEDGARLEAQQGRKDIGYSIQRIQGSDRLILEEYRRRAKATYQVAQPRTPKTPVATSPPVRQRSTSPPPSPGRKPIAEVPLDRIRLVSDTTDPFANEDADRLGQGKIVATPKRDGSSKIAETTKPAERDMSFDDSSEEPATDESPALDFDADSSDDETAIPEKKSNAVGAVIRALGKPLSGAASRGKRLLEYLPTQKSATPSPAPQPAIPATAPPEVAAPSDTGPNDTPVEDPAAEDPFANELTEDSSNAAPADSAGDGDAAPTETTDGISGEPPADSDEDPFKDE